MEAQTDDNLFLPSRPTSTGAHVGPSNNSPNLLKRQATEPIVKARDRSSSEPVMPFSNSPQDSNLNWTLHLLRPETPNSQTPIINLQEQMELVTNLASFLPRFLVKKIVDDLKWCAPPLKEPQMGCIVHVDISGISEIAESVIKGSLHIPEAFKQLNEFFADVLTSTGKLGGDLLQFTGQLDHKELSALSGCHCVLEILHKFYDERRTLLSVQCSLKGFLAIGSLHVILVSGENFRSQVLYTGNLLDQISAFKESCVVSSGLFVTQDAWKLVQNDFTAEKVTELYMKIGEAVAIPETTLDEMARLETENPEDLLTCIRGFTPSYVLKKYVGNGVWVLSSSDEKPALFDVLRVTVMVLQIAGRLDDPIKIQNAFGILYKAAKRYEGNIIQFLKGLSCMVCFGIPALSYEDISVRAIKSTFHSRKHLSKVGFQISAGIATGTCCSVLVGNMKRRSHFLTGRVVDRAILLSQSRDDTLCDLTSYESAHQGISFEQLSNVGEGPVYRPLGEMDRMNDYVTTQNYLVGRTRELEKLIMKMRQLCDRGEGSLIVVEGELGTGKSALLRELTRLSKDAIGKNLRVFQGNTHPMCTTVPYYAFRKILYQILELDKLSSTRYWPDQVQSKLGPDVKLMGPLLAEYIPYLEMAESPFLKSMNAEARATNMVDLLTVLIGKCAKEDLALILIEDAQWLDPSSQALLHSLAHQLNRITLVVTSRPGTKIQLCELPFSTKMHLVALGPSEVERLIVNKLNREPIPTELVDLVVQLCAGNPFYCEEVLQSLLDLKYVVVEETSVQVNQDIKNLPDSIISAISSRIDKLNPRQQWILKAATALGKFNLKILKNVVPFSEDFQTFQTDLNHLVQAGFLIEEFLKPDTLYCVKNTLFIGIAEEKLSIEETKELHAKIATFLESTLTDLPKGVSCIPVAYHWELAENFPRAIEYFEFAGNWAMRNNTLPEAAEFFLKALTLAGSPVPSALRDRVFHWEAQLGVCFMELGQPQVAALHLHNALVMKGLDLPRSAVQLSLQMTKESLSHKLRNMIPRFGKPKDPKVKMAIEEVSTVYLHYTKILYGALQLDLGEYTALCSLNLAEKAGPCPQLARNYSNMAHLCSLRKDNERALKYIQKALAISKILSDPTSNMFVHEVLGVYYHTHCDWVRSLKAYSKVLMKAVKHGSKRTADNVLILLAMWYHAKGNFQQQHSFAKQAYDNCLKRGDTRFQASVAAALGHPLLLFNMTTEALEVLFDGLWVLQNNQGSRDLTIELNLLSLIALAHIHKTDYKNGLDYLNQGLEKVPLMGNPSTLFYAYVGYAALCEGFITLAGSYKGADRKTMLQSVEIVLNYFEKHAEVFLISKPIFVYWRGNLLWEKDRKGQANADWLHCKQSADKVDMPFERALACYSLGKNDNAGPSLQYVDQAMKAFKKIGAIHQLERVKNKKREDFQVTASLSFDMNKWKIKKTQNNTKQ